MSSETAPPGGYAQFKISLTAPALVSSASISVSLDPAVFGDIASVTAFSATGDQTGSFRVQGQQVTAFVTSSSASLGQLPGMPVFVVTVPVLATAKTGATRRIEVDGTQGSWQDQLGNTNTVSANPGIFTVGGTLSVQSVTPGGGLLPSGTIVTIDGTGFDATTTVAIDGVVLSAIQLVSPQELDVILGGATEMSGKHVHVATSAGASVDYFAALRAAWLILPQLPSPPYTAVLWDYPVDSGFVQFYSCLQNSNSSPVAANYYFGNSGGQVTSQTVVIPPYTLYIANNSTFVNGLGQIYMTVSAPIRMAEYRAVINSTASVYPPAQMTSLGPIGGALGIQAPGSSSLAWNWQIGTPAPQPYSVEVTSGFPFTISVSGTNPWLNVTSAPLQSGQNMLTLTPVVSNLAAGSYAATVTVTEQLPPGLAQFGPSSASFHVTMNANSQQTLLARPGPSFQMTLGGEAPAPQTLSVIGNGTAAAFTTIVTPISGGNWLSVTPSSGTTPASLTVTANPVGLAAGFYQADLKVQGPINTLDYPVQLSIASPSPVTLTALPSSLAFSLAPGQAAAAQAQLLVVEPPSPSIFVSVNMQTGGNWLIATVTGVAVAVNASAVNLGAGTYTGTVTINSLSSLPATVSVTLTVAVPPGAGQLTVTPSSLTLTGPAGGIATGTLNVNLINGAPYFTMQLSAPFQLGAVPPNPPPLYTSPSTYTAPAAFVISATAPLPGSYRGSIAISWNGGSETVPIAYYATASAATPPVMSAIVNSGSAITGSIAPGELITILGEGLGGPPLGLHLDSSGNVATNLGGTQVLINGVAAPLIYTAPGQVNAIVPFEVAGSGAASIQVIAAGLETGAWAVPIAVSAPSIFTLSGSGVGQAAGVNQDGSINGSANPAARGSTIQIYATGAGQTSPASSTGGVAQSAANIELPIQVTIGALTAHVLYAGAAPAEIDGVIQINVIVPQTVTPGVALPVLATIGGIPSQTGVTVAIQ